MKHAEVFHAIADGKTVQYRSKFGNWVDWDCHACSYNPITDNSIEWRVKPEDRITHKFLIVANHVGYYQVEQAMKYALLLQRMHPQDESLIMKIKFNNGLYVGQEFIQSINVNGGMQT